MNLKTFISDLSLSAVSAGFIAVLVGYASAWVIVYQAAIAAGADQAMIESWIWALGLGMGVTCIGLSVYYKRPIIIAWSTPGAALLATTLNGNSIAEAIGIFVFVAALTLITGLSGMFDALFKRIPLSLASAMLAGILLQFGISIFTSMQTEPRLVGIMLLSYFVTKRFIPRYAVVAVLFIGLISAFGLNLLDFSDTQLTFSAPIWVTPAFNLSLLLGVGLPLFIVTMASQNVPGIAILRASSHKPLKASSLLSWVGGVNILLAPFGAFSMCFAAITAAICASEESHPDPNKRYIAGVFAGIFNIIAGILGATVVALFAAFPKAMIAALAGLALLGVIASSLTQAFAQDTHRDPALVTFLVTASGISFFNIASAFWGIIIGLSVLGISQLTSKT